MVVCVCVYTCVCVHDITQCLFPDDRNGRTRTEGMIVSGKLVTVVGEMVV